VNFTVEEIRAIMDKKSNIRNMCVIAQYPFLRAAFDVRGC